MVDIALRSVKMRKARTFMAYKSNFVEMKAMIGRSNIFNKKVSETALGMHKTSWSMQF